MNRWVRTLSATLGTAALLLTHVTPAGAASGLEDRGQVNIIFDALILRPMGIAVTALGSVVFGIAVAPIVAMTRPTDIRKPLDFMVLRPARYTFVDPLGHH